MAIGLELSFDEIKLLRRALDGYMDIIDCDIIDCDDKVEKEERIEQLIHEKIDCLDILKRLDKVE